MLYPTISSHISTPFVLSRLTNCPFTTNAFARQHSMYNIIVCRCTNFRYCDMRAAINDRKRTLHVSNVHHLFTNASDAVFKAHDCVIFVTCRLVCAPKLEWTTEFCHCPKRGNFAWHRNLRNTENNDAFNNNNSSNNNLRHSLTVTLFFFQVNCKQQIESCFIHSNVLWTAHWTLVL